MPHMHLRSDPFEMKNLAADPASEPLRAQLEANLSLMMRANEDGRQSSVSQDVEKGGALYRGRAFYSVDEYLAAAKANPQR